MRFSSECSGCVPSERPRPADIQLSKHGPGWTSRSDEDQAEDELAIFRASERFCPPPRGNDNGSPRQAIFEPSSRWKRTDQVSRWRPWCTDEFCEGLVSGRRSSPHTTAAHIIQRCRPLEASQPSAGDSFSSLRIEYWASEEGYWRYHWEFEER